MTCCFRKNLGFREVHRRGINESGGDPHQLKIPGLVPEIILDDRADLSLLLAYRDNLPRLASFLRALVDAEHGYRRL